MDYHGYLINTEYHDLENSYQFWSDKQTSGEEDTELVQIHLRAIKNLKEQVRWLFHHQNKVLRRVREFLSLTICDDEENSPLKRTIGDGDSLLSDLDYAGAQVGYLSENDPRLETNFYLLPENILLEFEDLLFKLEGLLLLPYQPLAYRRWTKLDGEFYKKPPCLANLKRDSWSDEIDPSLLIAD